MCMFFFVLGLRGQPRIVRIGVQAAAFGGFRVGDFWIRGFRVRSV